MNPLAIASILIGVLFLTNLIGWLLFARVRKELGKSREIIAGYEKGESARERQEKAERDHARTGDLTDDERFLRSDDRDRSP